MGIFPTYKLNRKTIMKKTFMKTIIGASVFAISAGISGAAAQDVDEAVIEDASGEVRELRQERREIRSEQREARREARSEFLAENPEIAEATEELRGELHDLRDVTREEVRSIRDAARETGTEEARLAAREETRAIRDTSREAGQELRQQIRETAQAAVSG